MTGGTLETMQALLDGRVDLAGCSPDELVSAAQRGADLAIVGGIVNRPVSWIMSRPGLREMQLRGKPIGVNQTRGGVSMVLRAALRRQGLAEADYEQVGVGTTPLMAAALAEGRIDAAMLTAPFDLDLARRGLRALLNVARYFPDYAFTTINTGRAWALGRPPELAAFFRATSLAGDLIADPKHRDAAIRALATGTGLDGEALERSYETYREPGVLARHGEVHTSGLEAVMGCMAEEGMLPDPRPRAEELIVPTGQPANPSPRPSPKRPEAERGSQPGARYPRVAARQGEAPPRYPEIDDDWEEADHKDEA